MASDSLSLSKTLCSIFWRFGGGEKAQIFFLWLVSSECSLPFSLELTILQFSPALYCPHVMACPEGNGTIMPVRGTGVVERYFATPFLAQT